MIEYRYLQPEDAPAAADIHIEGQPGTVLTLLGRDFLIELYRAVSLSEWGEGIGAFDNGQLVAQTAMAVSSERFFSEFKRNYLWRATFPVMWAILRNPKIVLYTVQGWNYAEQTHSPEREGDVIFLGVTHSHMRAGIAPDLVRYMFGWANIIGLTSANFMIEERNRPIRWMISRLNQLYIAHEFTAYGRKMLFYKIPIADNIDDAKIPLGKPYVHAYNYHQQPEPPPLARGVSPAGLIASAILGLLGLIHVYWASGGSLGIRIAIPSQEEKPLFQPSPLMTLGVAGGLFGAMGTVLGRLGLWGQTVPSWLYQLGVWGLSLLFIGRSIGDFRWVGLFKRVKDTRFAWWDSWLFTPLCLLIAFLLIKTNLDGDE